MRGFGCSSPEQLMSRHTTSRAERREWLEHIDLKVLSFTVLVKRREVDPRSSAIPTESAIAFMSQPR
jgi:hypothetical protein